MRGVATELPHDPSVSLLTGWTCSDRCRLNAAFQEVKSTKSACHESLTIALRTIASTFGSMLTLHTPHLPS